MTLRIPRVISPPSSKKHKSEFPKTYWRRFKENLSYQMGKYRKPNVRRILGRGK